MSNYSDGGPAFPRPSSEAHDANGNQFWPCAYEGMSLRDYFAAQALGMQWHGQWPDLEEDESGRFRFNFTGLTTAENIAEWVYKIADAMLAHRDGSTATKTEAREPKDG